MILNMGDCYDIYQLLDYFALLRYHKVVCNFCNSKELNIAVEVDIDQLSYFILNNSQDGRVV